MKQDKNGRISLTPNEADEIREYLETLFAMEGTLDEDFNRECHRAGYYATRLNILLHGTRRPIFPQPSVVESRFNNDTSF